MLWGIEAKTAASELVEMGIKPALVCNAIGVGAGCC